MMMPRGWPAWTMAALQGLLTGFPVVADAQPRSPERYYVKACTATLTSPGGGMARIAAPTFDDIPSYGPLPPAETRIGIVRQTVAALDHADAPAFGFLNAGFGLDDPATAARRPDDLSLGNHGYAHADLDRIGAVAFTADVARNEAPLAAAAGGTDWHGFRHAFRTPAVREAARADLEARRCRIAAVTMGFDDLKWIEPYTACVARGDRRGVATLEAGSFADTRIATATARARAQAAVGRDIPYVLLMHVGVRLPRPLDLYRRMGFRFVTLLAAQADAFYAAATDLSLPGPTLSLAGPAAPPLAGPLPGLCS